MTVAMISTSSPGLDIIGSIEAQDSQSITLKKPHLLQVADMGNGQYSLDLIPASPGNPDGSIRYSTNTYSLHTAVPTPLEKAYLERVSGIEIVTSLG